MKEVEVKIDLAKDGSGFTMSQDSSTRSAKVYKKPQETYMGSGHILIVPLSEQEEQSFSRQVVTKEGVTGLKVTNVKEHHMK